MSVWAILLSGGSGTRMGSAVNKTLLPLAGECALCRSLRTLRRHCEGVALVMRPCDEKAVRQALADSGLAAEAFAYGGADRQASVYNGLQTLPEDCDIVLVHDGARPLLDDGTVENVIQSVRLHGSGIASTPVTDTIKQVDDDWIVKATPDRRQLRAVQTPQGFRKELLLRAHREIQARYTDDAALVAALGVPVYLCAGSPKNIKLTTPEDKIMAEFALQGMPRVGHGYDAHRLVEERKLILGGVEVPYEKGLLGHSDADVVAHAIADALLGAAALGDIGRHFPDSDPAYEGMSGTEILQRTAEILKRNGFAIGNVDATLVAQKPKIAPYAQTMMENTAKALGVPVSAVSIKATTEEGLGFTGDGSAMACLATATVK